MQAGLAVKMNWRVLKHGKWSWLRNAYYMFDQPEKQVKDEMLMPLKLNFSGFPTNYT